MDSAERSQRSLEMETPSGARSSCILDIDNLIFVSHRTLILIPFRVILILVLSIVLDMNADTLSFLDVHLTHNNGKVSTHLYGKPQAGNILLCASARHPHQKASHWNFLDCVAFAASNPLLREKLYNRFLARGYLSRSLDRAYSSFQ